MNPEGASIVDLSSALSILARPVAYYPSIAKALGVRNGMACSLLFSQLVYWTPRAHDRDGWVYKTPEEWEEEVGLSYEEQKGARAVLRRAGLIRERRDRVTHRTYFRLRGDILDTVMVRGKIPRAAGKIPRGTGENPPRIRTEITTEITSEGLRPGADATCGNCGKPAHEKRPLIRAAVRLVERRGRGADRASLVNELADWCSRNGIAFDSEVVACALRVALHPARPEPQPPPVGKSEVHPELTESQLSYRNTGKLIRQAVRMSSAVADIGELTEQLKCWAAQNGLPYDSSAVDIAIRAVRGEKRRRTAAPRLQSGVLGVELSGTTHVVHNETEMQAELKALGARKSMSGGAR